MHRTLKHLLVGGGIVSAIGLIGAIGFRIVVNQRIEEQIAIANQTLEPLIAKGATETNATAQQLNQLLAEIEPQIIDSRLLSDVADSGPIYSPEELAFSEALAQYYTDLKQITAGPVPVVSETIRLALSERAETLSRIKTLLLENPAPVWAFDVSETSTTDPISDIGFSQALHLHTQLLALSLLNHQQGNAVKSRRYFQAARRLHDAVINYPVNGAYAGLKMAEQRVVVTRWTDIPEPIIAVDYNAKLIENARYGDAIASRTKLLALQSGGPEAEALQAQFEQPLLGPRGNHFLALAHIDMYQTYREARRVVSQHIEQYGPCDTQQISLPQLAKWNTPLQHSKPNVRALNDVAQLQLAAELNTLADEANAAYDKQQRWPDALSKTDSQVCPDHQWQYEKTNEGITITYVGPSGQRLTDQSTNLALTYSATGEEPPIAVSLEHYRGTY